MHHCSSIKISTDRVFQSTGTQKKAAFLHVCYVVAAADPTDGMGHKIRASVHLHITVAGQQYSQRTVAVVALQDTGVLLLFKLHCSDIVVSLLPCSVTVLVS